LAGLELHLHRSYQIVTASCGHEGLTAVTEKGPFQVVLSDLRMPGMDGVTFLSKVRKVSPDSIRLLLTGQADLEAAIAAVNQGQLFRFLTKPCPPPTLLQAIESACEQHRLVTAERVLLEQTLQGSIKTLTEILSLANPAAFGRATRIQQYMSQLTNKMAVPERWPIEVAGMLSQIGSVALPAETVEKLYYGKLLDSAEQEMVARVPDLTEKLLANIPRLEPVRAILSSQELHFQGAPDKLKTPRKEAIPLGARMLKVVVDFDHLEAQGQSTEMVLDTMRGRVGWYDPAVLEAFAELRGSKVRKREIREVMLNALHEGMIFAEDVASTRGTLIITRGNAVTQSLLARFNNLAPGYIKEPIRVIVKNN
jgi:response regulator RpfG family c-di-GMP phosphodiesterase